MDKQKIVQYITILILVLFVLEIFIIGIGNSASSQPTPTPTVTPTAGFTGTGSAQSRILGLGNQFFAECNTTNYSIIETIQAIPGVSAAAFEQSGIFFSISKNNLNESANISIAVKAALSFGCEGGYSFYREGFVLPNGNLQLVSSSGATRNITNYSLLSFAQSNSMAGIAAFVDWRHAAGDEAEIAYSVAFLGAFPSRAIAQELNTPPQETFQGTARMRATVTAIRPRLLVSCQQDSQNSTEEQVIAALKAVNGTQNVIAQPGGFYLVDIANVSESTQVAMGIMLALPMCQPRVELTGEVKPIYAAACFSDAFALNYAAGFVQPPTTNETSNGTCKNVTFQRMTDYAASVGLGNLPAILRLGTAENDTINSSVSVTEQDGRIVSLLVIG